MTLFKLPGEFAAAKPLVAASAQPMTVASVVDDPLSVGIRRLPAPVRVAPTVAVLALTRNRRLARAARLRQILSLPTSRLRQFQGFAGLGSDGIERRIATGEALEQALLDLADMGASAAAVDGAMQTVMGGKGHGVAMALLGYPVDAGGYYFGLARENLRQQVSEALSGSNIDRLHVLVRSELDRLPDLKGYAQDVLQLAEVVSFQWNGGSLDDLARMSLAVQDWLPSGGGVTGLAGALAQVAGGGLNQLIGQASTFSESSMGWLTPEVIAGVKSVVGDVVRASRASSIGSMMTHLGSAVSSIGTVLTSAGVDLGPAAPIISGVSGVLSTVEEIISFFEGLLPSRGPAEPLPIYSEHWGIAKLLLSAERPEVRNRLWTSLRDEGWAVECDPQIGSTMVRPPDGTGGRDWARPQRAVDLFDRRKLLQGFVFDWVRDGSGIGFQEAGWATPAMLYGLIPPNEVYVKLPGAMTSTPVPFPAGGDPDRPIGPGRRDGDTYWGRPAYRGAYVAAALLGGAPPYASYGYGFRSVDRLTQYLASNDVYGRHDLGCDDTPDLWHCRGDNGRHPVPHCLGVGGGKETAPDGGTMRIIPWASFWDSRSNEIKLIPPRKVPRYLDTSNTDSAFRRWLFFGTVDRSRLLDHEATDEYYVLNPGLLDPKANPRLLNLEQFVERYYRTEYDPDILETRFVRSTPGTPGYVEPLVFRLAGPTAVMVGRYKASQLTDGGWSDPDDWSLKTGGWGGWGTKLLIAGGLAGAGYLGWRAWRARRGG